MIDFDALNAQLLAQARTWLPEVLPGGHWEGREYVCASIHGGAGYSFKVNCETGEWADFADMQHFSGGDLVALYSKMRGCGMREAALALGARDMPDGNGHGVVKPSRAEKPIEVVTPAPDRPYTCEDFRLNSRGLPTQFWPYRSVDGAILQITARYPDDKKGKVVLPWVWVGSRWVQKGHPHPRPLYNLDNLLPVGPVLIVEGEKTCDAAQQIFPQESCITWSMGAGQAKYTDWTPLRGRTCTIWPDHDDAGARAFADVSAILLELGCKVSVVDPKGFPPSWDLADSTDLNLVEYRRTHTLAVERPKAEATAKPASKPIAAPAPLAAPRTAPKPRATVAAEPPTVAAAGSLDELYQRFEFTLTKAGRPHCNEWNVSRALAARGSEVYFDTFKQRVCFGEKGHEWGDEQTLELTLWLQRHMEMFDVNLRTVNAGVQSFALQRPRNLLVEWLRSLKWDGTARLKDLFARGFGAEQSRYTEAIGMNLCIAMVARALRPGCKHDCMPVLQGAEGIFKSRGLEALAGAEYFAELHESITTKDFCIALNGKWLCDVNELHTFKRAEVERIKGVISTRIDRYRKPYGTTAEDHPRSSVLTGTTNRYDWNTSDSGARRFWPIDCGEVDVDWIRDHRSRLFAEAVQRFNDGESWWVVPWERAEEMRDASRDVDPWEDVLAEYLMHHDTVRIPQLLSVQLNMKDSMMDNLAHNRVSKILRRNGYRSERSAGSRHWTRAPRPSARRGE